MSNVGEAELGLTAEVQHDELGGEGNPGHELSAEKVGPIRDDCDGVGGAREILDGHGGPVGDEHGWRRRGNGSSLRRHG